MTDLLTLDKLFRYSYCTTGHLLQGASVDDKIIIHERDRTKQGNIDGCRVPRPGEPTLVA